MGRTAASFARGGFRFKVQPRVLVICEDAKSSKNYLEDASHFYRSQAQVVFAHVGRTDPLGIVREAIKQSSRYDAIYCVIDRDTHEGFTEALELAKSESKIEVFSSYPCFEYWLLLHFQYTRAPYARVGGSSAAECVVRDLRRHAGMADYSKGSIRGLFEKLTSKLEPARARAKRALAEAEADGEPNPSTRLHTLIDVLRDLGEVKPVEE